MVLLKGKTLVRDMGQKLAKFEIEIKKDDILHYELRIVHVFFVVVFLRSGFNEPIEKSEETREIEDLRKSSVIEAKTVWKQERVVRH